jgi:hypothetical protein
MRILSSLYVDTFDLISNLITYYHFIDVGNFNFSFAKSITYRHLSHNLRLMKYI